MRALLLHKEPAFNASVSTIAAPDLSEGAVRVQIDYSMLNYKDGLAITNAAPVVRLWPMVAGINGAGTVLKSQHPDWKAGDAFVLNGWGVSETHWGCLAEQACLKGDWLLRRPAVFSARQAWPSKFSGQRDKLIQRIRKDGFEHTMEAVAYT